VDVKAIQITIDGKLLGELDQALKGRPRLRSAFVRRSIANELRELRRKRLEELHREGYRRWPVREDEFAAPDADRSWGDE
jgi:metal-responsive CopG/Arc/MetJ family transcriptional regulator